MGQRSDLSQRHLERIPRGNPTEDRCDNPGTRSRNHHPARSEIEETIPDFFHRISHNIMRLSCLVHSLLLLLLTPIHVPRAASLQH